jgi:hypothetical protein
MWWIRSPATPLTSYVCPARLPDVSAEHAPCPDSGLLSRQQASSIHALSTAHSLVTKTSIRLPPLPIKRQVPGTSVRASPLLIIDARNGRLKSPAGRAALQKDRASGVKVLVLLSSRVKYLITSDNPTSYAPLLPFTLHRKSGSFS